MAFHSLSAGAQAAAINVGVVGTAACINNWPAPENPAAAIDGAGQKYLNSGEFSTGIIVFASASTAVSLTLTAANDAEPRDPASYGLMGTSNAIGADPFDTSDFSLIASGAGLTHQERIITTSASSIICIGYRSIDAHL